MRHSAIGLAVILVGASLGACQGDDVGERPAAAGPSVGSPVATVSSGATDPGVLFGFGTPASAARVALWDIDVKPDGEGLPSGNGTVAEGKAVYDLQCLGCHGPTGVEGPNDRLVGTDPWEEWPVSRTVGNYWPYATTLYDYTRKAMPQATPGILSADDTYAVVAYVLYLNELIPEDAVMNPITLPAVMMPARDRFIRDDRRGGREVR